VSSSSKTSVSSFLTQNLQNALWQAVELSEVSGIPARAYMLKFPGGGGGWTIGFNQQDFKTAGKNAPDRPAVKTLEDALNAAGVDAGVAEAIAVAIANAGNSNTSQTDNLLSGITMTVNGKSGPATIERINKLLATNIPAQTKINNDAGITNYLGTATLPGTAIQIISDTITAVSTKNPGVNTALSDPTWGAAISIILADIQNKYPPIALTKFQNLLTTNSQTFNSPGFSATLNTSTPLSKAGVSRNEYSDFDKKGYGKYR